MKRILIVALALLTLAAVPVSAQTYLTTTTTSAAITSTTQDSITVASATNIEVGGSLWLDNELMGVTSVNGTRIGVSRMNRPATHVSGVTVIVAKQAQKAFAFVNTDAANSLRGSCSPSDKQFLPIVDTVSGDVYLCWAKTAGQGRIWSRTNLYPQNGLGSLLVNLQ